MTWSIFLRGNSHNLDSNQHESKVVKRLFDQLVRDLRTEGMLIVDGNTVTHHGRLDHKDIEEKVT